MSRRRSEHVVVEAQRDRVQLCDGRGRPVVEVNRFLDALAVRGLSPRTRRAYAFDLLALRRWLRPRRRRIETLRESDLLDWVSAQRAAGARPRSVNRRLSTCRQWYRFVTGHEIPRGPGASSPAPHFTGPGRDRSLGLHSRRRLHQLVLRVKVPRTIVEPLAPDHVRAFFRRLRRYRDFALVQLMLFCGLRSREVLLLRLHDVDLAERRLRVRGKGDKERMVPLPDTAVVALRKYLRFERPRSETDSVFVVLQGAARGQAMTAAGLRSLFRQRRRGALRAANPHRFRHTFGTDMARAGVRLPVLQRLMGHANASTTMQYIELSLVDIADEYRRAMAALEARYGRSAP
jgi:site-specific recombinase XerD